MICNFNFLSRFSFQRNSILTATKKRYHSTKSCPLPRHIPLIVQKCILKFYKIHNPETCFESALFSLLGALGLHLLRLFVCVDNVRFSNLLLFQFFRRRIIRRRRRTDVFFCVLIRLCERFNGGFFVNRVGKTDSFTFGSSCSGSFFAGLGPCFDLELVEHVVVAARAAAVAVGTHFGENKFGDFHDFISFRGFRRKAYVFNNFQTSCSWKKQQKG